MIPIRAMVHHYNGAQPKQSNSAASNRNSREKGLFFSSSYCVRQRPVPLLIALCFVIRVEFIPVFAGNPVKIVHDLPAAHCHLAGQFLVTAHSPSIDIHKTEVAVL